MEELRRQNSKLGTDLNDIIHELASFNFTEVRDGVNRGLHEAIAESVNLGEQLNLLAEAITELNPSDASSGLNELVSDVRKLIDELIRGPEQGIVDIEDIDLAEFGEEFNEIFGGIRNVSMHDMAGE